jgi:hypothetical protein
MTIGMVDGSSVRTSGALITLLHDVASVVATHTSVCLEATTKPSCDAEVHDWQITHWDGVSNSINAHWVVNLQE